MTIDFHAHPVPEAFRKWLPLLNIDVIKDDGFPVHQWSKEAHLQFMDDAGIDYTVLSLPTPHIHNQVSDMLLPENSKEFSWMSTFEK